MSRRPSLPSYTLHKPSGRARVRIDGQDVYLGPYDSAESRERYAQLLLNLARQQQVPVSNGDWTQNPELKVKELVLRYCLHAEEYYGAESKEFRTMRDTLKPVVQLFGNSPAKDFGPRDLKLVRQSLIDQGLCRPEINRRISRIRRAFRWATSEELIPPSVIHGLGAVQGLARGRSGAREPEAVRPVPDSANDSRRAGITASWKPFSQEMKAIKMRLPSRGPLHLLSQYQRTSCHSPQAEEVEWYVS